jgi:hemolysin activation/secretion protein
VRILDHLAGCLRAVLLSLAIAGTASAALAQSVPPAVDPGVIQRRLEPAPAPRPEPGPPVVPDMAPGVVPPEAETIRFTLEAIRLEGVTVYDEAELRPLWADLLGQEIALAAVFRLADAITVRYRNDGYILSRALVPPQAIEGGSVRVQIVEGHVDRVIVEGEPVPRAPLMAMAERIAAARPLRADVLERNLLLINELAGLVVDSVLRPSPDVPGAADLVLVTSLRRYQGDLGLSNRGNRFTGPLELSGGVQANGLLGRYDRTRLRGFVNPVSPNQLQVLALEHGQPLGSNGTQLGLFGSLVRTDPGGLDDDVDGSSVSTSITLSHPILLDRTQRLELRAELGLLNSDTDINTTDPGTIAEDNAKDRVRTLRLSGAWDVADRFAGITSLSGTLSQGLDILDASQAGEDDLSREAGAGEFTAFAMEASRLQSFTGGWSVLLTAKGQYAFDSLLVSETFDFGGETYGRAYDSSELTGDHGVAARAELRWGRLIGQPWLVSVQPFLSADVGAIWNRDSDEEGVDSSADAASVAAGVRFDFTEQVSGSVEVAQPLTRSPTIDRDDGKKRPRVFFRLNATF